MPGLRILPDDEHQLDLRHGLENLCAPAGGAFAARRQVPSLGVQARKTEAHRHDGNPRSVVKRRFIDPHPFPQAVAGRIGKWYARCVNPRARCLSAYCDARRSRKHCHRSRLVRQWCDLRSLHADAAPRYVAGQGVDVSLQDCATDGRAATSALQR